MMNWPLTGSYWTQKCLFFWLSFNEMEKSPGLDSLSRTFMMNGSS
jgi:hypothetical protein